MRNASISLLLSALWHLFCFSSVTIVSLPPSVRFPRFSEVVFVGSILTEPDFEVRASELSFGRRPEEVVEPFLQRRGRLIDASLTAPSRWGRERAEAVPLEETLRLPQELFLHQKASPLFSPELFDLPHEKEAFHLEGPAAHRALYYRPPQPQLPRWVDVREIRTGLQFKFWISPKGRVASIEKLISSGDPAIDLIGMRYLRKWQFSPKEKADWGTVGFSLKTPEEETP